MAGHGVVRPPSNPKQLKKFNDVVEIFHNTRLKNSNSGVSSKYSKVDAVKYEKKPHPPETVDRRNQQVSTPKDRFSERKHKCQSYDQKNKRIDDCPQTLNCENNSG